MERSLCIFIYFTGGAKRNEFVDYFICVIIGVLWGLGYLRCIELGVKIGIESRLATAMVIFVLTTILCTILFILPSKLRLSIIPVMFGAISMIFSQNGVFSPVR